MTAPYAGSPWSPELDAKLRQRWVEGTPTKAIGEELGLTKSAIVGRARRLGLAARPSPIPAKQQALTREQQRAERRALGNTRGPRSTFGPPRPATVAAPMLFEEREGLRCRWPMWGYSERAGWPQRFCTASRRAGECYCDEHAAVAYPKRWHWLGDDARADGADLATGDAA